MTRSFRRIGSCFGLSFGFSFFSFPRGYPSSAGLIHVRLSIRQGVFIFPRDRYDGREKRIRDAEAFCRVACCSGGQRLKRRKIDRNARGSAIRSVARVARLPAASLSPSLLGSRANRWAVRGKRIPSCIINFSINLSPRNIAKFPRRVISAELSEQRRKLEERKFPLPRVHRAHEGG